MGKGKPGFLTPKAIANRIKAKGLQKLRWYCQMCQKQCRDENGFKCHTMSESHQRQLLLFADNSRRYLDEFSRDFKSGYILTLKRRFGTKRVNANVVYQEYISDRNHIHMNATKWLTLTNFVQYLGREGICTVDQTEKGWFVQYIDRDPETIKRQLELEKKHKLEIDDRERQLIYIEKQVEKAKEDKEDEKPKYTDLQKAQDETIKITFKKVKVDDSKTKTSENLSENKVAEGFKVEEKEKKIEKEEDVSENIDEFKFEEPSAEPEEKDDNTEKSEKAKNISVSFKKPIKPMSKPTSSSSLSSKNPLNQAEKRKLSALEEIIQEKEVQREKQNRKDYWLYKNIIVKIITNKLGDKYLNKKGVVMAVKDVYIAIIKLLDSDTIIKVDQAHLETVLPAIGKKVFVVNGAYRGVEAILEDIDTDKFTAKIRITSGPHNGRIVNNIQYEDISKLHNEEIK